MSNGQSKQDVRKLKINSLIDLIARNDYATAKFLRIKLYKEEWGQLVASGKITEAQATKCMAEGMLKEGEMPRLKLGGSGRANRFQIATPDIKIIGDKFEKELNAFLDARKADLLTLDKAGFTFRPQWRNAAMQGSRKKKNVVGATLT